MPNSILPQDQNGQELFNTITSFFHTFGIGNLLRKCNAQKEKGVPVLDIFKYKLCNVFADRSMYMQQKTGAFRESFSKNTFYRFLNSPKTNWLRFTTLLSKNVADRIYHLQMMTVLMHSSLMTVYLNVPAVRERNSDPKSSIMYR